MKKKESGIMSEVNKLKLEVEEEIKDWFKLDEVNIHRVPQNNGTFNIIFELCYKGISLGSTTIERYTGRGKLSEYYYSIAGEDWEDYLLSIENGNKVSLTLEKTNLFTNTVTTVTTEWYFDLQNFLRTGKVPDFEEMEKRRRKQHEEDLFNFELFDRE